MNHTRYPFAIKLLLNSFYSPDLHDTLHLYTRHSHNHINISMTSLNFSWNQATTKIDIEPSITWEQLRDYLGVRENTEIVLRFPSKKGTLMSVRSCGEILPFALYSSQQDTPFTVQVSRGRRKKSAGKALR